MHAIFFISELVTDIKVSVILSIPTHDISCDALLLECRAERHRSRKSPLHSVSASSVLSRRCVCEKARVVCKEHYLRAFSQHVKADLKHRVNTQHLGTC